MKVICIDGGRRAEDIGNEPLLSEGAVYTVEREVYGNTSRGTIVECYKLTSISLPFVYVKDRFILCSDGPEGVEEEKKDRKKKQPEKEQMEMEKEPTELVKGNGRLKRVIGVS